ncbi:MAG: tripartite tricarboxylate transporter substrate binding protein [Pusillimonas sp.]
MFKWMLSAMAGGLALAAALNVHAAGGNFPDRPITLIIPVAAGGTTDIAGRALAKQLKDELGQTVVVENRPGASGSIANAYVARAKPDGYTLVLSYEGFHTGNPVLMKELTWDPIKDFTPIAEVIRGPHLILVPADSPARTLQEFIDNAKQSPGSMNFASSGVGSIQHLGGELFQLQTGVDMVHVPYGGAAPAMQDLLAGRINMFITTPPTAISHVEAGKLRALAITSSQRHPKLPDIPTTAEAGLPEFQLEAWFSVFGPPGMPDDVVKKLAAAMEQVITSDEFREQMNAQGSNASYRSPDELAQIVKDDLAKWTKVVETAGITAN